MTDLYFKPITMKQLITFIFLPLLFVACNDRSEVKSVEASDHAAEIKKDAETMKKFLLNKDYPSFVKFTYPKLVEMAGGEQKMVETFEETMKQMEAAGTIILDVTFGEPTKVIKQGNELQCTIPQLTKLKMNENQLSQKSTLIAISENDGKTWYFINASSDDIHEMQKNLPNLSSELVLSKTEESAMEKK
jgi:hypothetical protein